MADQPSVILTGFADEAANQKTVEQQFAAFAALGLDYFTIRFVDAGNRTANKTGTGSRCSPVWPGYWGHARVPVPLLFDITSGALSRVWGFFRRQGQFPQAEDIDAALQRLGGKHVELDTENETIRFLQPDLEINLNAIGKGYALDRCAESIEAGQVHDFLIHGGQSSVLARGDRKRMQAEAPRGWQVALRHPLRDGVRMGDIWLRDRALGTSGAAKQYFYHQGRRYGHVIDPRTGWPAEGVFSASVIAPTAALADALSTAFYVMGPAATAEYCRQQPHVAAILVCPARRSGSLAIHEFNVEPSLWTMRDEFAAARVSPPSTSIE
jgi:hypothetical protein